MRRSRRIGDHGHVLGASGERDGRGGEGRDISPRDGWRRGRTRGIHGGEGRHGTKEKGRGSQG